jgi:Protein of unknown function (DUF1018)
MNHIAAIHTIAKTLSMSTEDRRHLMLQLVRKESCKEMNPRELAAVRAHLEGLQGRMLGKAVVAKPAFAQRKAAASAQERYLHVLWRELCEAGKVNEPGERGLNGWVQRQCGLSAPRFASSAQLAQMIEQAKLWLGREPNKQAAQPAKPRANSRAAPHSRMALARR